MTIAGRAPSVAPAVSACLACDGARLESIGADHRRCVRCGFVFAREFDGSIARERYRRQHASGRDREIEALRVPLYEAALARHAGPADRRCLDVGCGAGTFVRLAAERGWLATGVDPEAADADASGPRLIRATFPCGPALGDERFDLVTFFNSLNYVADPLLVLREAHRVLRPGGAIVVRVPNVTLHLALVRARPVLGRLPVIGERLARAPVLHPRSFSRRSLASILERADFWRVRVEGSALSENDPYRTGRRAILRQIVGRTTVTLARCSLGRVLWTPSLLATATRPHGGDAR